MSWFVSTTNDSQFVTVTKIDVDDELNRAHVCFVLSAGADGDDVISTHSGATECGCSRRSLARSEPRRPRFLSSGPISSIRSAERIDEICVTTGKVAAESDADDDTSES